MFEWFYFSVARVVAESLYKIYKWRAKKEDVLKISLIREDGLFLEVEVKAPEQVKVSLKAEKLEFKLPSITLPPPPPAPPIPITLPEINVKLKIR